MASPAAATHPIPERLRQARRSKGLSITDLAQTAAVSPRLISEFERGKRPNVSLETATRLLAIVGLALHAAEPPMSEEEARKARAEHRRRTITLRLTTILDDSEPEPPDSFRARFMAVAQVSRSIATLQDAARASHQKSNRARQA
jgi:transcriptional regulator with XRE-family HTH domain